MIEIIYFVISIYFALGGIATYMVFKNRKYAQKKQAWTKYWVYLIIIYGITTLLISAPNWFPVLAGIIILVGLIELVFGVIHVRKQFYKNLIIIVSIMVFGALSSGFLLYSFLDSEYLLFAFFIVASFDGFSQITGQLFGKSKVFPRISPGKTLEGLILGFILSVATGGLIGGVSSFTVWQAILFSSIIAVCSLIGDMTASAFKRWCGIKDFSSIIPGHGGVLDRFDSLLTGGAAMYVLHCLLTS